METVKWNQITFLTELGAICLTLTLGTVGGRYGYKWSTINNDSKNNKNDYTIIKDVNIIGKDTNVNITLMTKGEEKAKGNKYREQTEQPLF